MDAINTAVKDASCNRVAVIGAGFIGLEMVEQLHRLKKQVHLIEKGNAVLPQADAEMAEFLHGPLIQSGIATHFSDGLQSFATAPDGTLLVKLESGAHINVDVVVLCIGVVPETQLAKDASLSLNPRGYIAVNDFMQTSDASIYAVGDAIETKDLVFPERKATVALGNIANMQARIAADHMIRGSSIPYKGSLGTSIVRVFDYVLALTGWNEKRLLAAGIPFAKTVITSNSHASYYPGALPITMKVTFDPVTGRVYGAQAFGIDGVDKRIDVIAAAISGGLTIDDLSLMQLCYSPPFGSARDVVNIAGLAARNIKEGLVHPSYDMVTLDPNEVLLDVRPRENAAMSPVANSINIPFKEIASRAAAELDKSKVYRTVCALGKTAYFSSRELIKAGFNSSTLIGGLQLHAKPVPTPVPMHEPQAAVAAAPSSIVSIDLSGMACPGPLLKLRESIGSLPDNAVLQVTATDPGFYNDVKAFAASNGLNLISVSTSKGIVRASISKSSDNALEKKPANGLLPSRKGATIVVFSQDLDKVLGALVIANGAAAMGGEVTLFFTFWGLNALRDPTRNAAEPKDMIDSMFGMMMPKGNAKLPLSNLNFGGWGATLMKYVMANKHLPNLPGLLASAKAQNIRLVACTMSMEAMGIRKEELIDGVELGGVADYLAKAESSGTNLFI